MKTFIAAAAAISLASLTACGPNEAQEDVAEQELESQEDMLEEQADMADEMGMEAESEMLDEQADQMGEMADEVDGTNVIDETTTDTETEM